MRAHARLSIRGSREVTVHALVEIMFLVAVRCILGRRRGGISIAAVSVYISIELIGE